MTQTKKQIACLDWQDEVTGAYGTFVTDDFELAGTWNGFPAVRLPKWQMFLLDLLITQEDPEDLRDVPTPSTEMDEDLSEEAAYVHCDGLQWYLLPAHERATITGRTE